MIQSKKVWTISAGILSGILLLVLLFRRSSPEMFLSVFSFPLLPLAKILRSLSLKGGFYNVLAWLLYLDLSLSPLYVLFLRRKKERLLREVLLGAGSALLFYALYQLMNPRNLSALYGDFGGEGIFAMLMGGVLYSILFSYIVLSALHALKEKDRTGLFAYGQGALYLMFLLFVFQVMGPQLWQWISKSEALLQGNTAVLGGLYGNDNLTISQFFLLLQFLLGALPYLLGIPLLYRGARLLELSKEGTTEEAAALSDRLGKGSVTLIQMTVLMNLSYHFLQLLFFGNILSMEVTLLLPVLPMMASIGIYLLTVLLKENKALREDNDLFI